jgi:hypothetical protein
MSLHDPHRAVHTAPEESIDRSHNALCKTSAPDGTPLDADARLQAAVSEYLACGWAPNPTDGKKAILSGWQKLTAETVRVRRAELWPLGTNRGVALLLGTPGGPIDIDCDCAQARTAAPLLLPPTEMVWGRASAPDSHWGYLCTNPPVKASTQYLDPVTRATIVELRSRGGQTCVPPTRLARKDGTGTEPVVWRTGTMGVPTPVGAADLARAVERVAAAALLARYWPEPGGRHDAHLALAGALVRSGMPATAAEALLRAVCAATGDNEVDDRVRCIASTVDRADGPGDTTGWPTLGRVLGTHGAPVVAAVRQWLGAGGPPVNTAPAVKSAGTGAPTQERSADVHGVTLTAAVRPNGRVLVAAARGPTPLRRDVLNLDSDSARARYMRALLAVAWPDDATRPADAESAVAAALLSFAADPPRPDGTAPKPGATVADPYGDPRPAALTEMDPEVVAEAEALLRDPRLIDRIAIDIERMGVTGERKLATTIYLVGTSTQLPRPLSAIIIGATASGKSYILISVTDMFPPEMKLLATDMTANALYYLPEGRLHHRLVVGGERSRIEDDHRAEAKRALREMLESQILRKLVTVSTDGPPETITIVQRGPIGFLESTTNSEIFEEDRNRCLSLYTDESPEQTRAIIQLLARRAAGGQATDVSRVMAVHHALQRMIPRCDVVIPFAPEFGDEYPDHRVDGRRAFRHLLQTVKAVALLHFRQRERDAAGNIVATRDDYRIAVDLAEVPLAVAVGALSPGARAFHARLSARFEPDRGFTVSEAVDVTGCPKSSTHRHLTELAGACLVEVSRGGSGRADVWRRTSRVMPTAITLPHVGGDTGDDVAPAPGPAAPINTLSAPTRPGPTGEHPSDLRDGETP